MKEVQFESLQHAQDQFKTIQGKEKPGKSPGFDKILMDSLKDVNRMQQEASVAVQDLAIGKKESIHETMIAMEKASVSFELMMQIRNKIIDAYQEIIKTSM